MLVVRYQGCLYQTHHTQFKPPEYNTDPDRGV